MATVGFKNTSFPPQIDGQVIKRWTVKGEANYPGSAYTRTCALKPEMREAITPSLSKEIEDVLGPELFEVYSTGLKLKVASDGRGKHYSGTALPALPKPVLAPGTPLEKSGKLKRSSAAASVVPLEQSQAHQPATHQVTWTSFGPIPSHSYVESERIDSLDEWLIRFGRPANVLGQHAHTQWRQSRRLIGGTRSQVVSMKPGNMTR